MPAPILIMVMLLIFKMEEKLLTQLAFIYHEFGNIISIFSNFQLSLQIHQYCFNDVHSLQTPLLSLASFVLITF